MVSLDQRKKYFLIIGIVLLVFALLYRFSSELGSIYPSDSEITALSDQLISQRHQLKILERMKARTEQLEDELARRNSNLFSADTPSLAAVEIQKIIDRIASQNNVEISSTQVLNEKPVKGKPYIEVPIRLTFSATIDQLRNILYEIELDSKYLKVIDAKFRSPRSGGENRRISINLTVAGLLKPTLKEVLIRQE